MLFLVAQLVRDLLDRGSLTFVASRPLTMSTGREASLGLIRSGDSVTGGGLADRVAAFRLEGRGFKSSHCRSTSHLAALC